MQIYLPELKQKQGEVVDFSFDEELSSSLTDLSTAGTLKLVVSLSLNDDKLVVNGSLEVSTTAACSRCLETFNQRFTTDFSELFTILKNAPVVSNRQSEALETANMLTVSGDYLYLDEYVRQLIILGQEYNPICSPGCKGLCAGCGEDLNKTACRCSNEKGNIDLRFIKLKELNQER